MNPPIVEQNVPIMLYFTLEKASIKYIKKLIIFLLIQKLRKIFILFFDFESVISFARMNPEEPGVILTAWV